MAGLLAIGGIRLLAIGGIRLLAIGGIRLLAIGGIPFGGGVACRGPTSGRCRPARARAWRVGSASADGVAAP